VQIQFYLDLLPNWKHLHLSIMNMQNLKCHYNHHQWMQRKKGLSKLWELSRIQQLNMMIII